MDNSSSDDRRDRSSQNRQGQRGGRRRQNNRGENRNSGGGQNRRNRSGGGGGGGGGGNSRNRQGGGKREYRPSNRGRQTVQKPTFGQRLLSILTFGLLGGSSKPAPSGKAQSGNRNDGKNRQSQDNRSRDNNRPAEKVEVSSARLYVGNLDYKTTDADLKEHFSKLGSVKSAEIVMNRRTQQSKGFAFVEMDSIEEARKAVDTYHNEDFMGRRMLVSGAKSSGASEGDTGGRSNDNRDRNRNQRSESNRSDRNRNDRGDRGDRGGNRRSEAREEPARRPKKTEAPVKLTSGRLRLDNLDFEVGEDELEELFKGIGVVVGTEVVANPDTHQSKGYGFVEMSHLDEAKRAVEILNNKDFMGRRLAISDGGEKKEAEAPAAVETPAVDSSPATDETPAVKETPEATETPAAEASPATDEAPAVDETPEATETPAAEESPAVEEKPEEGQNETTPAVGA